MSDSNYPYVTESNLPKPTESSNQRILMEYANVFLETIDRILGMKDGKPTRMIETLSEEELGLISWCSDQANKYLLSASYH